MFSSNLPFSRILVKTPNILYIVLYYLFIVFLISINKIRMKKNKRRIEKKILLEVKKVNLKKVIVIFLIIILVFTCFNKIPQDLKIYFIDVSQGDSTLIITPNKKTLLIDGGGSENFNMGEKTLLPYMLDRKVTKLDYVLITHFDTDHVAGLFTILEELKVDKVIICKQEEDSQNYQRFKSIVKEKKLEVIIVKKRR